jgi:hypothetical protein
MGLGRYDSGLKQANRYYSAKDTEGIEKTKSISAYEFSRTD